MALTLQIGAVDLSPYVRLQPGEGFDPAVGGYLEPQFSHSSLREGGTLVADNVNLKELVWPLILDATSKDALHALINTINRELDKPTIQAEFRDVGASASTFYDVARGRLDVDFNYWRGAANHVNATLHVWVQPFGSTGTDRLYATGLASGNYQRMAPASAPIGDAPPLTVGRVTVGGSAWLGRVVGVAGVPASWSAFFPAASLTGLVTATLRAEAKAHGSQVLGLSPGAGADVAAVAATIPVPSVHAGRNRILALARINGERSPMSVNGGAYVLATMGQDGGFSLVDLGVVNVRGDEAAVSLVVGLRTSQQYGPSTVYPDNYRVGPGASIADSHQFAGLLVLPDDNMALIEDVPRRRIAFESFVKSSPRATGLLASIGLLPWDRGQSDIDSAQANLMWQGGGFVAPTTAQFLRVSARMVAVPTARDMIVETNVALLSASRYAEVGKMVAGATADGNAGWLAGVRLQLAPSPMFTVVAGDGFTPTILGTGALPSYGYYFVQTLFQNDRMLARIHTDATAVQVNSSNPNFGYYGQPGFAALGSGAAAGGANQPVFYSMLADTFASVTRDASYAYRFTDDGGLVENASRQVVRPVEQRGRAPRLASGMVPVVFQYGSDVPPALDPVATEVRVRERFRYAR